MEKPKFSPRDCADLFQQLGLLLQAGIPLGDGLHLLADEEKDSPTRTCLSDWAQHVTDGIPLHEVLAQSECFSAYAVGLLEMADRVGRMEATLFSLAHYYEDRDRTARQLRNALTYPAILLVMMAVVIVVLLTRVLPIFEEVYASLGGSLNGLAAGLLALGKGLSAALPFLGIALLLILLCISVVLLLPSLRKRIAFTWNRLFGDRGIARKMNNAHFAQALAMTISSGLPIEEGIELAAVLLNDRPQAKKRCEDCLTQLQNGVEMAEAFKMTGLLPSSACRMLVLGMRAGNVDGTMQEIANRLSEEADDALENKVAQIEPALVLLTSVLVGAILLAVMLPLINIMKVIG